MDEYGQMYLKLKNEFETYQNFAEIQIQTLSEKNIKLEKNLDALVNIVEISKYINSYLSDENLISMINDMIIGILGVTYSSIYLKEEDELFIKATNIENIKVIEEEFQYLKEIQNEKPFVLNCKPPLFKHSTHKKNIHSVIGVPIHLRDKFIGYIIVEHTLWNFFNYDHIKFISSIANQIGIAIENSILYKRIQESAKRDPLLDIYNRKFFFDFISKKISDKSSEDFAIVMMDIDDFKKVNDRYGHQFGDEALMQTSNLIKQSIRESDILARYGGEELVIYLDPVISKEKITEFVDNIRKSIENHSIDFNGTKAKVTASFGISYYPCDGSTFEDILNVADNLLYKAKNSGKNRVLSS